MSGYLYQNFINYIYNNPLIILIYSLFCSFIILFINKVKLKLYIILLFIVAAFGLCLFTNNLLFFLFGIELYNILFLLLLYNTLQYYDFLIEIKKLSLLSMVISCIMLFGTTLILLNNNNLCLYNIYIYNILTKLGLYFILIGILFKLCVFPFHIWILNIYKKSPYYIVLISDCFFKLIILLILIKFVSIFQIFNNVFAIFGIISMFLGIILLIKENNIKRFLGLFNISHIGLILLILSINNTNTYKSVFGYLLMYSTCSLIFILQIKDNIENFRDFSVDENIINKTDVNNIDDKQDKNNIINSKSITYINDKIINNISIKKYLMNNNKYCKNTSKYENTAQITYIICIISLLAMIGIPPFHTFLSKIDLISVILKNNKYTVLMLSTMYFILEIIVIIIKIRFILNNTKIQSSFQN